MNVFNERMKLVGKQLFKINGDHISNKEEEALKFLYAYMPLVDITDYVTDYHLANTRSALRAQEEMPWEKDVPELLFRHFVLPVRFNNEALDMSRPVFLKELSERVKNLSMYEAILEVNH